MFKHYDNVRNAVANTGKQHPQLYGDWKIGLLPISHFIGYQKSVSQNLISETKIFDTMLKESTFDKDDVNGLVNKQITKTNKVILYAY